MLLRNRQQGLVNKLRYAFAGIRLVLKFPRSREEIGLHSTTDALQANPANRRRFALSKDNPCSSLPIPCRHGQETNHIRGSSVAEKRFDLLNDVLICRTVVRDLAGEGGIVLS